MSKKIRVTVCKGRHEIPQATDGAIFEQTITEMNPAGLFAKASERLICDYELITGDMVHLYVTGLTMATLAIVNVCHSVGIQLMCHHYNKETGRYIPQFMH